MKAKVNSGQSLFEVVVAVGISALIITGIVAVALNSIQNSSYAKDKNVATTYVQETMEWLRRVRDQETANFKIKADQYVNAGVFCLTNLPTLLSSWPAIKSQCTSSQVIPGTKFIRYVEFLTCSGCPSNVVRVKATVYWIDAKGTHEVNSSTDLSVK